MAHTPQQLHKHFVDLKRRIDANEPYDKAEFNGPLEPPTPPPPLPTAPRALASELGRRLSASTSHIYNQRLAERPDLDRATFDADLRGWIESDPDAASAAIEAASPGVTAGVSHLNLSRHRNLADMGPVLRRHLHPSLASAVEAAASTLTSTEAYELESIINDASLDSSPEAGAARLYSGIRRLRPDALRAAVGAHAAALPHTSSTSDPKDLVDLVRGLDSLPPVEHIERAPASDREAASRTIASAPLANLDAIVERLATPGEAAKLMPPPPEPRFSKAADAMTSDELEATVRVLSDRAQAASLSSNTVLVD